MLHAPEICAIFEKNFDMTDRKKYPGGIELITLTNSNNSQVTLSNLGAGIVSAVVPDRHGNMADVVLGYADPTDYLNDGPCAGKIPGRYANRIARGRFSIDGEEYRLAVNNGPNALHGGPTGFQNRIWEIREADSHSVLMAYTSADGEEGYPGELRVEIRYTFTDGDILRLEIKAETSRPTIVNLTNHAYFNLAGHNAGSVLGHTLQLMASHWLPTDDTLIPTGSLSPVAETPMDFTSPKALGRDIKVDFPALRYGKGYDNCWAIDNADGTLRTAAVLSHSESGRTLTVATDQPGVQVYTGNWLDGCPAGKGGAVYHDYDAVAIECQAFPDAPNHAQFPSAVLRPGEVYHRTIEFAFSAE